MNGSPRAQFLRAGGGGALAVAGLMATGCGGGDDENGQAPAGSADGRETDLEILNYALALELLETSFYEQVVESGVMRGTRAASLVERILENEQAHVETVTATVKKLGGSPVRPARESFETIVGDGPGRVLKIASMVENLGASAYLGQAPRITSDDVLAAALSIHAVEARQAAAINELADNSFAGTSDPLVGSIPDGPFARPADISEVLGVVRTVIDLGSP